MAEPPLDLKQNTLARPNQRSRFGRPWGLDPAATVRILSRWSAFSDVALSEPNISDTHDEEWSFRRPLGKGGFGQVGLWVRENGEGMRVDECALKESQWRLGDQLSGLPGVTSEAVYQNQLNRLPKSESILKLRRYKFYQHERRTRMMFDACVHGDLARLWLSYRMFDRYLPETFLWHVFNTLAHAVHMFQFGDKPWQDYLTGAPLLKREDYKLENGITRDDGAYLLHFDLKLDNVFLGKSPMEKGTGKATRPRDWLPSIQVGDFGLSLVTDIDAYTNPSSYWVRGTPGFMPPEQRHVGVEWRRPPQGQPSTYPGTALADEVMIPRIKFLPAFNVWGVGKILNDLVFLALGDRDDIRLELFGFQRAEAAYRDFHFLRPRNTLREPEYSAALKDLIRRCTRIDMRERPTAAELIAETDLHLKDSLRSAKRKRGSQPRKQRKSEKVYCRGNTINKLGPSRKHIYFPSMMELEQMLVEQSYMDVDEAPLRLGPKWDQVRRAMGHPGPTQWWPRLQQPGARYEDGRVFFDTVDRHVADGARALSIDSGVLSDSDDDPARQVLSTKSDDEKINYIYRQLEREAGGITFNRLRPFEANYLPILLVRDVLAGEGTVGRATAVLRYIRLGEASAPTGQPVQGLNGHPVQGEASMMRDVARNLHLNGDFWPIQRDHPNINHRVILYLLWKERSSENGVPSRVALVRARLAQLYP